MQSSVLKVPYWYRPCLPLLRPRAAPHSPQPLRPQRQYMLLSSCAKAAHFAPFNLQSAHEWLFQQETLLGQPKQEDVSLDAGARVLQTLSRVRASQSSLMEGAAVDMDSEAVSFPAPMPTPTPVVQVPVPMVPLPSPLQRMQTRSDESWMNLGSAEILADTKAGSGPEAKSDHSSTAQRHSDSPYRI